MSGNRANAAARQRRATEVMPQQGNIRPGGQPGQRGPPPYQNIQQQQQMQQQQQQQTKLSISDAIALITLRLGRVETYVQKIQIEGVPSSNNGEYVMEHDDNARIVSEDVFKNIISRLDALERGHKNMALLSKQPASSNSISNVDASELNSIHENISSLQNETGEIKDLVLKLQTYTMDTNTRLLEFVLNNQSDEIVLDDILPSEEINENNIQVDVDVVPIPVEGDSLATILEEIKGNVNVGEEVKEEVVCKKKGKK
jgi:hypothetical protein